MKQNIGKFIFTALAITAITVSIATCSGGGGGGSNNNINNGQTPASYSTPTQAAAAVSISAEVMSVISAQTQSATDLGMGLWTYAGSAPPFEKGYNSVDIGKIHPTFRTMADQTTSLAKTRIMQEVLKETAALKAMSYDKNKECSHSGSISVSGTINGDGSGIMHAVFNNCMDTGIQGVHGVHVELNGTVDLEYTKDASANGHSEHMTEISTKKLYTSESFTDCWLQQVTNVTYHHIDNISSGSHVEDGTIVVTRPRSGETGSIAYTKFGNTWTLTVNPSDGSATKIVHASGTVSTKDKNNVTLTLSLDLIDKFLYVNDVDNTKKEWLNGSMALSWTPDTFNAECVPGSIVMSTLETDPVIYTDARKTCPSSGTFTINNATFKYGASGEVEWPGLGVTIGGTTQTFASCEQFNQSGAVCNGAFTE